MTSEQETEAKMQNENLDRPYLSPEEISDKIAHVDYHIFERTRLTVCCVTLKNGFSVTGESACVSPENFNAQIGRQVAFQNARDKIWELEGYLLRQRLHEQQD